VGADHAAGVVGGPVEGVVAVAFGGDGDGAGEAVEASLGDVAGRRADGERMLSGGGWLVGEELDEPVGCVGDLVPGALCEIGAAGRVDGWGADDVPAVAFDFEFWVAEAVFG